MRYPVLGLRRLLPALFALAIVVWLGDRAEAACGDWLDHGVAVGVSLGNQSGHAAAKATSKSEQWPVTPPCRGPRCRQAPAEPAPFVPVRLPTDQVDQWCCFLTSLVFACRACQGHLVPGDEWREGRTFDLLDPPPRS